MNENIQKEIQTLKPFKHFCMSIGELPSSYLETMTYYEMLVWFTKYLGETVIPVINNNGEAVSELQTLFTELQNYVNNYFDNLDVQEEVNNKLDEMADSGQLADIIAQYLEVASVLGFDTKATLKNAENLAEGSIARTLGTNTYNDGKGDYYKIRTITSGDVIDDDYILALANYPTLIAEKLPDYRMNQVENAVNTLNNTTIPDINTALNSIANFERSYNHKIFSIAHRGLCSEAPENTYASIIKAGVRQCDGVEIDLQCSSDGVIFIMHDSTVDRTTNGTGILNELTSSYIDSLEIDTGNFLNAYPTQKVPRLEESLILCNEYNLIPMLELKGTWTTENLQTLLVVLNKTNLLEKCHIISFDYDLLKTLRNLNSNIRIELLYESAIDITTINDVKSYNIGLSLDHTNNMSLSNETQLALNGVFYGFWTVNDRNNARSLINNNKGMSFITSDYGYGNYKQKVFRSIGLLNSNGFEQWQLNTSGNNAALYYDMFTVNETSSGSKRYHVEYATPFFTYHDDIFAGNIIMTLENQNKQRYEVYCTSQREYGFDFRIVDSSGNLVSLSDLQTAIGDTYFTITCLY